MSFATMVSLCVGNATKGVSLSKHADVLLRKCYDDGFESCWMITFKVGRMFRMNRTRTTNMSSTVA